MDHSRVLHQTADRRQSARQHGLRPEGFNYKRALIKDKNLGRMGEISGNVGDGCLNQTTNRRLTEKLTG